MSASAKRKSWDVEPHPLGGWQVRRSHGDRASRIAATKGEAVQIARELARAASKRGCAVSVRIAGPDGKLAQPDRVAEDPTPGRLALRRATRKTASFHVDLLQENDGRWIADIAALPGVTVYGQSRREAATKVKALALRVLAEQAEHGERDLPDSITFDAA
jgi:predicted RNase H-like HicB family nuclease